MGPTLSLYAAQHDMGFLPEAPSLGQEWGGDRTRPQAFPIPQLCIAALLRQVAKISETPFPM